MSPFPYLVVDQALPLELYNELARSFPSTWRLGIFNSKNNRRWNYTNAKARGNPLVPKLWREFLAYHSSQAFFDEFANLFADAAVATYPERFPSAEALKAYRAGARTIDSFANNDVLVEAMLSGNTPVTEASSVRTTHVDAGDKLYSGLFYMRPDDYSAVGGDLTISRFKPEHAGKDKLSLFRLQYVDDANVDIVETIPYAKNKVVLFINSLDALHGVTVRQPTRQSRLFVNLVGEVTPPLYVLPGKAQRND